MRSKLISVFQNPLPGIEAHKDVLPSSRKTINPQEIDRSIYRSSSVAVIFFEEGQSLKSLLIERAVYNGTHSGQMGFPGGKVEKEDKNLLHTAMRECLEETNVLLNEESLVGELTEVIIPVSKFIVQPYAFYLDQRPNFSPDPTEVQRIVTFDVHELLKNDALKYTDIRTRSNLVMKKVPYFDIQECVVWGATALILSEVRLLIKNHF